MPKGKAQSKSGGGKKKGKVEGKESRVSVAHNASRAMLVINPVAGAGKTLRIWEELEGVLRELQLDFDYRFTEAQGHAIEIGKEATRKGYGLIGVVGGDGTLYEVVNGIMFSESDIRPSVGIIPSGRGSDYCRTVGIPQDWQTAASLMVSGRKRLVDLGKMKYRNKDGSKVESYFINIAGVGFDGEVTERANEFPKILKKAVGGTATYLLSLLMTYASYTEKDIELQVDDELLRVLAATVVVANGQYFGGKMRVAPEASPDDGLFDVIVIGAGFGSPVINLPHDEPAPSHSKIERVFAKFRMAKNVPGIYRGSHLQDPSVLALRGKKVKVISDERLVLQADGEVIGEGPLSVEVIPGAIEIVA